MSIVDNVKDLSELVKKYNDQDLYERIISLREEILTLREENLELHEKINKLESASELEAELYKKGNCYYKKSDTAKEQPFCMTCWDVDRKLVSLILSGHGSISCSICIA